MYTSILLAVWLYKFLKYLYFFFQLSFLQPWITLQGWKWVTGKNWPRNISNPSRITNYYTTWSMIIETSYNRNRNLQDWYTFKILWNGDCFVNLIINILGKCYINISINGNIFSLYKPTVCGYWKAAKSRDMKISRNQGVASFATGNFFVNCYKLEYSCAWKRMFKGWEINEGSIA